jgi:hypothetical protein
MTKKSSQAGSGALPFFVGLVAMLFVGWYVFPRVLYSKMEQPIQFSHTIHADSAGMACEDCHFFNDDGTYNGIPSTSACADCHSDVLGGSPEEEKFVAEYVNQEKEVAWLQYQDQPDNVFFTHAAHQDYECKTCHPDVMKSEFPPLVYRDKLTGYNQGSYKIGFGRGAALDKPEYTGGTMKMWECERCHALSHASNACYVCHR